MEEQINWWKKRINLLKLTLIIITLDYILEGLLIIFIPDLLGPPTPASTVNFGQSNITIGIFAFFLSRNPQTYEKLIWIMVFQEFALNTVTLFQILTEVVTLSQGGPVLIAHSMYLLALGLLMIFKDRFPDPDVPSP